MARHETPRAHCASDHAGDCPSSSNNTTALAASEAARRRLEQENAALTVIGRMVASAADVTEIYRHFADQLGRLIHFDGLSVSTIGPKNGDVRLDYVEGIELEGREPGKSASPEGSTASEVIKTHAGLVLVGSETEALLWRFPRLTPGVKQGLRSLLLAPIVARDHVIGVIHLSSKQPNAYDKTHLVLVERISSLIGGAVHNAQLRAEREQLEQQLIHAQKMEAIGRLAGGIAHDFNNLLTPILGYAQVGMRSLPCSDPAKLQLQRIYDAAERASNLVKQLLTFSRKDVIKPKTMSLSRLIADMDGILRRLIGENIELITRPKADLGLARMDTGQMEQVLFNLVVNARDAMPGGGRIIIETDDVTVDDQLPAPHPGLPQGQYVRMSVRDNGIGMTPEVKARVFDPFFTTKDVGKGTGLGLSTCYGIISQIGGHIFVDSELGQGSTFTIYLPRIEGGEESHPISEETIHMEQGTESVLLVEDEMAVREIAAYVLNEQGYRVFEAATGPEALSIASERPDETIHLLLTDVVMPGMGGRELADRLRAIRPGIKVLYTSGYTSETIMQHGVLETGTAFLQKPFRPDELARKVREVIETS